MFTVALFIFFSESEKKYICHVTYWPSTELSIKRYTCVNNRCIRSKTSGYHLDLWMGWIRCNCDAHKKHVDVKQLYNPLPQTVWVSWSQLQLEFELQFEAVRTSSRQRACGPQWPPVEQSSRMRKKSCYSQRNLVNKLQSVPSLLHISHTTLSQIKCERYIFLKKCVRSSLLLIMFPHIHVYVQLYHGYTKVIWEQIMREYIYIYIYNKIMDFYWMCRGLMVIVVGNWHGDTSSNPGRDWLRFT